MKLSQEVRHHFFSETRVYIAFRIVFSCCQFQFLEFSIVRLHALFWIILCRL